MPTSCLVLGSDAVAADVVVAVADGFVPTTFFQDVNQGIL